MNFTCQCTFQNRLWMQKSWSMQHDYRAHGYQILRKVLQLRLYQKSLPDGSKLHCYTLRKTQDQIQNTVQLWPKATICIIRKLHGGRDDSILSAILAKWPPKSRHQRNSCQILQNCAIESRRACSKTIVTNSPIHGFFDTDSFMSYVYEHHCLIGIFVGPLNTNCIKYQANQKWAKLELSLSRGKFKERKQEGLQWQGHLW